MKKQIIAIFLILASFLPLAACSGKEPTALPEYGLIYDIFEESGETFAVCCEGEYSYIYNIAEGSGFIAVPGGDHAVWSKSKKLIYYGNGYKVYSSTLDGRDKRLIWELPGGGKKDFARVELATDDMLLIACSYGEKNSALFSEHNPYLYTTYDYYALDPKTGIAEKAIDSAPYTDLPSFMGSYNNKVYYLIKSDDNTVSVRCADLITHKNAEIGAYECDERLNSEDMSSCILGNSLYFSFDHSSIYAGIYVVELDKTDVAGERVERITPDNAFVPEMKYINDIALSDDNVYLLTWNSVENPTSTVCRWDTLSNKLENADSEDRTFPEALKLTVSGRKFYVSDGRTVSSGTLK